ncbi:hypothetical protein GCM10010988_29010 [Cnuibacter physcomitrellae]|uniref:Uncharacterized protein n=1 Tax=Cnuibacter physcomitrellae TaxID=1619308 RepID=A0A1X9LJS2_9MICO|nr:helix-turn-helix domain-containing protein [Cnuibacter physcomitrellae]ARJ04171.1 hypothetical protein B5808_02210 [Cnuibacter physcomitrellae]GGI40424.1 hypothetical protein GCM10010988_29010 [Cnuibacter physcomitrellae]
MRGLRPTGDADQLLRDSAATPTELASAVEILGPEIAAWAVETALRVVADVHSADADSTMSTGRERQGCEECLLSSLVALHESTPPERVTAPPGAVVNARAAVRQGLSVGAVLRTVWASHTRVLDALLAVLGEEASSGRLVADVRMLNTRMFDYANAYIRDLSDAFDDERRLWNGRSAILRRSVLEAIAAGEAPPADAEAVLGLPLSGTHVIAYAWASATAFVPDRGAEMHRLLVDLAVATSARDFVAIGLGDVTALWWRYPGGVDPTVVETMRTVPRPSWVRLAVGPPGAGAVGVRTSVRTARDLRRLAGDFGSGGFWSSYADGLGALLASDPEAAERFVETEIGPLRGTDARRQEIRETLRLYLRFNRSRSAVATHLTIAPNTVAARVQRAKDLMGLDLDDRWVEILIALEIDALNLSSRT